MYQHLMWTADWKLPGTNYGSICICNGQMHYCINNRSLVAVDIGPCGEDHLQDRPIAQEVINQLSNSDQSKVGLARPVPARQIVVLIERGKPVTYTQGNTLCDRQWQQGIIVPPGENRLVTYEEIGLLSTTGHQIVAYNIDGRATTRAFYRDVPHVSRRQLNGNPYATDIRQLLATLKALKNQPDTPEVLEATIEAQDTLTELLNRGNPRGANATPAAVVTEAQDQVAELRQRLQIENHLMGELEPNPGQSPS